MSWLGKWFGRVPPQESASRPEPGARVSEPGRVTIRKSDSGMVRLPEIGFFGQCATSPNGRFTLLWRGDGYQNDDYFPGRYVLLDGNRVLIDIRMDRPDDGKVSDTGSFVLTNHGPRDRLAGTFLAFTPDGRSILTHSFDANIWNNGLSADGRLAVCQVCNAPDSPDSSVLTVFDLAEAKILSAWKPESGWADGYAFPSSGDRIQMLYRDRDPIEYGLDGSFIDRRKWVAAEVAHGTYYVLRDLVRAGIGEGDPNLEAVRTGLRVALGHADALFRADVLRLIGELEEANGDIPKALAAYDEALAINPKIGVLKRAEKLRRSAAAGG